MEPFPQHRPGERRDHEAVVQAKGAWEDAVGTICSAYGGVRRLPGEVAMNLSRIRHHSVDVVLRCGRRCQPFCGHKRQAK
jgi:hypothetical protein